MLGENHPDTLSSLSDLADLYDSQGRYNEAQLMLVECIQKMKVLLGENHPHTLICKRALALLKIKLVFNFFKM